MSKSSTPDEANAAIWAKHEQNERFPASPEHSALLAARRAVAELRPGCARAILNDDPMLNWDRGRLVADELAKTAKLAENG